MKHFPQSPRATRIASLFLSCLLGAAACGQVTNPETQSYGQPPTPQIVSYVVAALQQGDLPDATALVAQYRRLNGDTPEALYALAWLARGQAAFNKPDDAQKSVDEIEKAARTALSTRKVDAEPYLPLALGSAYEVQAELLTRKGERTEALQLLRTAMTEWRGTSLVNRMQKNINLLTLQGKPAPLLRETEWIGPKPANPNNWRGKDTLVFFWAHWCADCKAESPIIARIAREFEPKGLAVVAPTRLYGYTAQDDHAPVSEEKSFVEKVFAHYYGSIPNAAVPLDTGNFTRWGGQRILLSCKTTANSMARTLSIHSTNEVRSCSIQAIV